MNTAALPAVKWYRPAAGFSLIEVLVALIVISVGLLGVAGMQALSLSSTSGASTRSLVAIEAVRLGTTMRANRGFWSQGLNNAVTITGTTISDTTLSAVGAGCKKTGGATPCSTSVMAAYDTQQWAAAMNQLVPNATTTINCPKTTQPITCTIQVTWAEKSVSANSQEAARATAVAAGSTPDVFQNPTYTLYVQP
jgi:type IV pilus assembly protein PilV